MPLQMRGLKKQIARQLLNNYDANKLRTNIELLNCCLKEIVLINSKQKLIFF